MQKWRYQQEEILWTLICCEVTITKTCKHCQFHSRQWRRTFSKILPLRLFFARRQFRTRRNRYWATSDIRAYISIFPKRCFLLLYCSNSLLFVARIWQPCAPVDYFTFKLHHHPAASSTASALCVSCAWPRREPTLPNCVMRSFSGSRRFLFRPSCSVLNRRVFLKSGAKLQ